MTAPTAARATTGTARAVSLVAVAAWVLAQIVYSLVEGSARDTATMVVLCAGSIAMIVDVIGRRGVGRGVTVIAAVSAIVFAAEVVGTRTGFPFGAYGYATDRIGPAVADVPILITAAWFMGAYAVWRVAAHVVPTARAGRVAIGVVGLVSWDLYLDPQMVAAGLWRWDSTDSGLPGMEAIPLTNFAGWAVVGLVVMGVFELLDPPDPARGAAPVVPLVWLWWTWAGSAFAQIALLENGALRSGVAYGIVGMGVLAVPAIVTVVTSRRRHTPRPTTRTDAPHAAGRRR
ncbi:carotenoid biosynthesis protein [Williamsia sp. MIQD14]|uniref:carotenoid biosynthesis protein n=1 Tax=Williamsia sp. MIQD14 TaxID=3425703 RepID=UPI003DA1B424